METKRIKEEDLLVPALYEIYIHDGKLTTGQLIKVLTEVFNPTGEDAEILFGRKDTRFSQKVRNLISHKKIYPKYADYESASSLLTINETGINFLIGSDYYKNQGQEIKFEFDGAEDLVETSDIEELITSSKKHVDCEPLNYSVFELKRRYDRAKEDGAKGILILDDSFQRKTVWTRKQKSQLIESLLLGIPIPYLYLYEGKYGNLIVIDGRQRLSAIFQFLDNKFALSNMEFITEIEGKKAKDLTDNLIDKFENYKAKIEDSHLHVIRVGYETPEIFKLKLFERVNQNGTKLNNQELRHALHQGLITDLLADLSDEVDLLSKNAKERMKDRYLMLRYMAMRLYTLGELKYYYANKTKDDVEYNEINTFLANAMDAINTFSLSQIDEIKQDFLFSYNEAKRIFGNDAFKLDEKAPINMILFEITLLFISLTKGYNFSEKKMLSMLDDFKNYDKDNIDKDGNTPFFQNIKYHRDGKDNFKQRIDWLKEIINKYKDMN